MWNKNRGDVEELAVHHGNLSIIVKQGTTIAKCVSNIMYLQNINDDILVEERNNPGTVRV